WRQEPQRAGISGRPRLHLGSLPLVRAAVIFAHGRRGQEQFDLLVRRTEKPFEQNVFGDPAELVELEQFVAKWCADLEQKILDRELGSKQALAILTDLITTATQQAYDFDTSRQLSGAMAVICQELDQAQTEVPYLSKLRQQLNQVRYQSFELSPQEEKSVELRYPVILERRARYQPEAFTKLMVRFQQELAK
ncbi:MAG: hypothetical protein MI725_05740, partial [Pirellulales bacterium]|nr:hypothetical protein [Pirellulales bacterium]